MYESISDLFQGKKNAQTTPLLSIVFEELGQVYYRIGKRIESGEKIGNWNVPWRRSGMMSNEPSFQKLVGQDVIDHGIDLEETRRWGVPLNNHGNDSPTKITVTQTLTIDESVELGHQQQQQKEWGLSAGVSYLFYNALLKYESNRMLQSHYRRSFGASRTETRSIELSAAPNMNMEFILVIKHVWHRGEIVFKTADGKTIPIEFRFREGAELALVESRRLSA